MDISKNQGISIFQVIDYVYCPRIIYYEEVLKVFGNKMDDFKRKEEKRMEGKGSINRKWI
jgi:hypothetical protein